jgi:hypothetical protein
MTRTKSLAWSALRLLYAAFFLLTGIWILVSVTTGLTSPPPQPTRAAADFMRALGATGFMDPLLGLSFVFGGGALLFHRTAPLGLVVLAPSVTVILLFHLRLSGQIAVGLVVAGLFPALAWRYRRALASLWDGDRST